MFHHNCRQLIITIFYLKIYKNNYGGSNSSNKYQKVIYGFKRDGLSYCINHGLQSDACIFLFSYIKSDIYVYIRMFM